MSTSRNVFKQVLELFKKPKPPSSILITGDEPFLFSLLIERICAIFLGDDNDKMNISVYDGQEMAGKALSSLLSELQTSGMFSSRKVVIFRNCFTKKDEKLHKHILHCLEQPSPDVCFIMTNTTVALTTKALKPYGNPKTINSFKFPPITRAEVSSYIDEIMKGTGIELGFGCKELIEERIGADLSGVKNFVDSLVLFKDEGKISIHEVKELIYDAKEETLFSLVDAVAEGDFDRAYLKAHTLMDFGTDATAILHQLFFKFRVLFLVKYACEIRKIKDINSVCELTGVKYYPVKMSMNNVGKFTFEGMKRIYLLLHDTDRRIKTSAVNPKLLIERLIVNLCEIKKAA